MVARTSTTMNITILFPDRHGSTISITTPAPYQQTHLQGTDSIYSFTPTTTTTATTTTTTTGTITTTGFSSRGSARFRKRGTVGFGSRSSSGFGRVEAPLSTMLLFLKSHEPRLKVCPPPHTKNYLIEVSRIRNNLRTLFKPMGDSSICAL